MEAGWSVAKVGLETESATPMATSNLRQIDADAGAISGAVLRNAPLASLVATILDRIYQLDPADRAALTAGLNALDQADA